MRLVERILSLVAPHDCIVCGEEGTTLCFGCKSDHLIAPPSRCVGCLKLTEDFKTCSGCQPKLRTSHVWVASNYEGPARKLVREFKFSGVREAGWIMGEAVAEVLPQLNPDWVIVPMPTITKHVRTRGFDHSRLMAARVAQYKQLRFAPLLGRLGQATQVGASRKDRQEQLKSSMYIIRPFEARNAKILLIDDVMTTGGSLAEAARALKAAGAHKVYAAVFAQKVL